MSTNSGLEPASAGTTRASSVSVRPTQLKSRKRVSHSAVTGTSSSATESTSRAPRTRRSSRAMAKPAIEAVMIVSGTASATTASELSR